jgi:hypothetical protein
MREAGYLDSDYQLVVMSYPSPVSPDVEDNPKFPGWYDGGCLLYLKDAAFGRNKAVPMFEEAERAAALAAPGVRYLDNRRCNCTSATEPKRRSSRSATTWSRPTGTPVCASTCRGPRSATT